MEALIDGLKIGYDIAGAGETVLLLHGWGGCIGSMNPVAKALSAHFQTLSVDLPGFGTSGTPPEPWSVTEYEHIITCLLEQLGIKRCHVVAHSFGGRIAILMACKRPALTGKMVLTDSAGLIPKRSLKYYFKVYRYKAAKKAVRSKGWLRLLRILGWDVETAVKNAGSEDYRKLDANMKKTFVRVVNQNLRPCLKDIRSPVLLIWGDQDQDTPLYMARIMEQEIPDAGLVVMEGAGHFAYAERSTEFNHIVSYFLKGS
jgi:pimeloyl-ACP methyl ester carboxylesterase